MVASVLTDADREGIVAGPQGGPQTALLSCPIFEIFFGGGRGGGKTYGILLHWIKHASRYCMHAKGVLFRRTYNELDEVQATAKLLFLPLGAYFRAGIRTWIFPNGAELKLRHLSSPTDADKYQGHQYSWMAFDELTNWPNDTAFSMLFATVRSAAGVQCQIVTTGNPGGVGHNWVKARYIDNAPVYTPYVDPETGVMRVFIPSLIGDNPALLENDPEYVNRLKATGADWLVKAWLAGDWNIVAGGMFDDVWKQSVHEIPPFVIPKSWIVDRAFDAGFSAPFSIGWWAESDGTEAPNGIHYPRGTLFRIHEWYGYSGKANEGIRLLTKEIGLGIREIEYQMMHPETGLLRHHKKIRPGPADTAIWQADRGVSIADEFELLGIAWEKADKSPGSRVNGWQKMRSMFAASLETPMEEPGLFVFNTCNEFRRTVPTLPRSPRDIEDVDTNTEDHIGDEARYRCSYVRRTITEQTLYGL